MQPLAEQPLQSRERGQLNHEVRNRIDTVTWLAEVLDGNMRTEFDFSFDGQELYGEDGGAFTPIFDDAILEAQIITQQNPSLLFELRRRLTERGELDDMKAMAAGELYTDDGKKVNTIVVPSDFPDELMAAGQDVGGYNRKRRPTMLRIITLQEDGIRVTTQSLDQSNRQALEGIYKSLGKEAEPGEMLGQRVNLSLSAEEQAGLADTLTEVYDTSMSEQFGGPWYAGRQPVDYNNTYEFARAQHDLINWFTAEQAADPVGAEKLRYKLAATAQARYERYLKRQSKANQAPGAVTHASLVSVDAIAGGRTLLIELEWAGQRAARQGKTFSGCGVSSTAETDDMSTEAQLEATGYGNKIKAEDGDCEFKSKKCPECGTKDVWTKVRKVGENKREISGDCGCVKTVKIKS